MMKNINFLIMISALLTIISCVPGSDGYFDEISVGELPLGTGNKWTYDIRRGNEFFTDSSEVIGEKAYNIDEITVRWLNQYKNIAMTLEELYSDTARIKLVAYDSGELKYYGIEKRDRTQSHFIYGEPLIFDTPVTLTGYYSRAEEYFIDYLKLIKGNSERVLRDTLVGCYKLREIREAGSFISQEPSYDLDLYYTGFGIIRYEGYVNGAVFSAKMNKCIIK
jgi:hypothetical protein